MTLMNRTISLYFTMFDTVNYDNIKVKTKSDTGFPFKGVSEKVRSSINSHDDEKILTKRFHFTNFTSHDLLTQVKGLQIETFPQAEPIHVNTRPGVIIPLPCHQFYHL